MLLPAEQVFIGGTTAAMCLAGLCREGWLLQETRKGQRLSRWLGDESAVWVLRLLLACGLGFGVLLAVGVINPVRYSAAAAGESQ